jgi:hypothetical protein
MTMDDHLIEHCGNQAAGALCNAFHWTRKREFVQMRAFFGKIYMTFLL